MYCVDARSLKLHYSFECDLHLCPPYMLRHVTLWLSECIVLCESVVMSAESRSSEICLFGHSPVLGTFVYSYSSVIKIYASTSSKNTFAMR